MLETRQLTKKYVDRNIFKGFKVKNARISGENFTVNLDENKLTLGKKEHEFDLIFSNEDNLWLKIRGVMDLEDHESCVILMNGLSGSGKSYNFVGEQGEEENRIGVVLGALRDVYDTNMRIKIKKFRLKANGSHILDFCRPYDQNEEVAIDLWGDNLESMERHLFDTMKRNNT